MYMSVCAYICIYNQLSHSKKIILGIYWAVIPQFTHKLSSPFSALPQGFTSLMLGLRFKKLDS